MSVQAVIRAQAAFEAARAALAKALNRSPFAAAPEAAAAQTKTKTPAGIITSLTACPTGTILASVNNAGISEAGGGDATTPNNADSVGSAAPQAGSPGSVENQPQRANQAPRAEGLNMLPGLLTKAFRGKKDHSAAPLRAARPLVLGASNGAVPAWDAVPGRRTSADGGAGKARGTWRGPNARTMSAGEHEDPNLAERSLALMDDGWSARSFLH